MLDFVSRDFSQYAWSLRTLDRGLHHFQICQTDRNVTVDEVEAAVKKELEEPGKLLGYRVIHKKIQACLSFECAMRFGVWGHV